MKIKLGVMFGGKSTEHEISIISAVQAMLSVDTDKYEIIPIYITKDNRFFTGKSLLDIENYKDIPALLKTCKQINLVGDGEVASIYQFPPKKFGSSKLDYIDIAFPIVHGTNTEDGVLAGFIEMLGIPYVGCDVCSSALGMDKYAMKTVFSDNDIPVLDCKVFTSVDYVNPNSVIETIEQSFTYPVIIKPSNLGSSIGITIAKDQSSLKKALENAFSFAQVLLVERAVTNIREINCSVLGDRFDAQASECEEPITDQDLLSFEDKYMSNSKSGTASKGMASVQRKIPANLSKEMREEIRTLAVKAFKCLGCNGVSRIDFIIDCDEGKVYLNEINTIPGSLSFYLWEPVGTSYKDLLSKMIDLGMKRHRERQNLTFSFDSNVLAGIKLGGTKGAKR